MKRLIVAIILFCLVIAAKAFEYGDTFKVGGIYYTVVNAEKLEVAIGLTYRDNYREGVFLDRKTVGSNAHVSGDFEIPSVVSYWGEEFQVVEVNGYCFSNAKKLEHVQLPTAIKRIEERAFAGTGLRSINLPSGITEIEYHSFDGSKLCSINLPSNIEIIKPSAFAGTLLESIVFPPKVAVIEDWAFSGCKLLRYVELNEGLERIECYVFEKTKIQRITLPSTIKYIGWDTFPSCLSEIKCNAVTPPRINYNSFDEKTYKNGTLWVPSQSVEAYRADERWRKFKTIKGF